jgi:hypothetical protein
VAAVDTRNALRVQLNQLLREQLHTIEIARAPTIFDLDVAAVGPSQFIEALAERDIPSLRLRIRFGKCTENADRRKPSRCCV